VDTTKKGYIIIALIVLLIMVVDLCISNIPYAYAETTMIDLASDMFEVDSVGLITKETVIIQTFLCTENMINGIALYPSNYGRLNEGELNIQLVDQKSDTLLKMWEYDVSKISSDQAIILMYDFYDKYDDMKGRTYKIIISGENLGEGTTLTLYKNMSNSEYDNCELWVDGIAQDGNLKCKINGVSNKVNFRMVQILIYLYLLIVLEVAWKLCISISRRNREIKI
jgi:hypothetical protein